MNLDSLPQMKSLDKSGVYLSISALPDQMEAAWNEVKNTKISPDLKLCKNIVVAGMGGSALGGRILGALFAKRLRVPLEVVTGYHLPHYIDTHTLVILSSYSGNTEETLSQAKEAKEAGSMIYGITTGGKLKNFLEDGDYNYYIYSPKYNPCGQPRMALGYSIFALLSLLSEISAISISNKEVEDAVELTREFVQKFSARSPKSDNPAKMIANKIKPLIPILVSSEHLYGVAYAMKNQINENAKVFSALYDLPELNHHLMEGLRFPPTGRQLLHFIFIESKHYSDRVQKRYPITQEVIDKNEFGYTVYKTSSTDPLEEVCEILVLGSYISFYLAMLHEIDPAPIPWVDYFKEKMAK